MEPEVESIPESNVNYPSLLDRFQSNFIDTIFLLVLVIAFSLVMVGFENAPDWIRIVFFFGICLYEPVCTSLGFTIGNYLKGIRVRNYANTDKRINVIRALFRFAFKVGLGIISFFTIHSNPQKRAIHDMVAGSVMIKN